MREASHDGAPGSITQQVFLRQPPAAQHMCRDTPMTLPTSTGTAYTNSCASVMSMLWRYGWLAEPSLQCSSHPTVRRRHQPARKACASSHTFFPSCSVVSSPFHSPERRLAWGPSTSTSASTTMHRPSIHVEPASHHSPTNMLKVPTELLRPSCEDQRAGHSSVPSTDWPLSSDVFGTPGNLPCSPPKAAATRVLARTNHRQLGPGRPAACLLACGAVRVGLVVRSAVGLAGRKAMHAINPCRPSSYDFYYCTVP